VKRSPTRESLLDKSSLSRTRRFVPTATTAAPRVGTRVGTRLLRRRALARCGAAGVAEFTVKDGRLPGRRFSDGCGAVCAAESIVNDGRLLITIATASESNVNRIETLFIVLLLNERTLPELLIERFESESNSSLQS
jgi:hypothetical protein